MKGLVGAILSLFLIVVLLWIIYFLMSILSAH
jgi:hypothetical protein